MKPTPHQRITVTGHLPIKVDYDGQFSATNLPPGIGALGVTQSSTFKSSIKYPSKVSVGYGVDASEKLTLGADFEWAENSVHKFIPLDITNNQPPGDHRLVTKLA